MEGVTGVCLGLTCFSVPILLVIWWVILYALGLGGLRLPGVSRQEVEGKAWAGVSQVARGVTEVGGILLSLGGALFGFLGYLLPWLNVRLGISGALLEDLANLIPQVKEIGQVTGSWSGAAVALQSLIFGVVLARGDSQGAFFGGLALVLFSLALWLLLVVLLLLILLGVARLVAIGKARLPGRTLGGWQVALLILAFFLTSAFLIVVQASAGGVDLSVAGLKASITVAGGFWITAGGLVLALVGAFISGILAVGLERWTEILSGLRGEEGTAS